MLQDDNHSVLDSQQVLSTASEEVMPISYPNDNSVFESAAEALKTVTEGVVTTHDKSVDANNKLAHTVANRYMDYLDKRPELSDEQKERIMDRIDHSLDSCIEQAKDQFGLLKEILRIIKQSFMVFGGLIGLKIFFSFLKDVINDAAKKE